LALLPTFGESVELNLFIQDKEHAGPPEVYGGHILFYYEPPTHVYMVGARFSHENYKTLHVFRKNANNIFVLAIPAPEESMLIKYRLMVDGVWMYDPANSLAEKDQLGTVFSMFPFEKTDVTPIVSPLILANGDTEFVLQEESGASVAIAGDFNAYDPFSLRLEEKSPGLYRIRLTLYPGRHYYYFIVNGVRMTDPRNDESVVDADRNRLSLVTIP
jgi:hypothetical protein